MAPPTRTRVYVTNPESMTYRETVTHRRRPRTAETVAQAVMEAAPFETPVVADEEMDPIYRQLHQAMETALTPRELWIVEARIWRRMSYRQLEQELSLAKSYIDRIYKVALRKLGEALGGPDGDVSSAMQMLFGHTNGTEDE